VNPGIRSFQLLHTPRLLLRELREEDADSVYELRSDEKVNEFIDRPRAVNVDDGLAFILLIKRNIVEKNVFYWAMELKEDMQMAGTICLWNFSEDRKAAEIGFELLPSFQGKGLASEALEAVLHFGFEQLELQTVLAWFHRNNQASARLLSAKGFKQDQDEEEKNKGLEESKTMIIYSLHAPAFKMQHHS
jgi:[ribosomal protein S5]-alanine N-acetyltransferase